MLVKNLSVQSFKGSNSAPSTDMPPKNASTSTHINDQPKNIKEQEHKSDKKLKIGVFLTTLAGVAAATAITFKKDHGKPLSEFFKTLCTVKYDKNKNQVENLVTRLALGSVGGGLIGGAIFDKKENLKAKARESVIQLVGNIFTPLICVSKGMRYFEDKLLPKILEKFPEKYSKDVIKIDPKTSLEIVQDSLAKKSFKFTASGALLIFSIFAGNKIGNFINKHLFKVDDERKLKLSDMSPHIDDSCLAISLVAPQNKFGDAISRFIPAALMVAGYSVGTAKEKEQTVPIGNQSKTKV